MPEDNRSSSRVASDTVTIPAGDSTAITGLELGDEQTFVVGYIKVEYDGAATVQSSVTVYDEDSSVTAGNLADEVDRFLLSPDERVVITSPYYTEIEKDLVVNADGNSDAEIQVTVGGPLITG